MIVILYLFVYFIIGLIVGSINLRKIKDEKFEWLMYCTVFWPIYVPCIFYDYLVNAVDYVNKQIKKFKK